MLKIQDNNSNNNRRSAENTRSRRDDESGFSGIPNAPLPCLTHRPVGSPVSATATRLPSSSPSPFSNNNSSRFSPGGDHHSGSANPWLDSDSLGSFQFGGKSFNDAWVDDLGGLTRDFNRMNIVDGTKTRGSYDANPYACSFDANVNVPFVNETGGPPYCNVAKGYAFEPSQLAHDRHVYHQLMDQRIGGYDGQVQLQKTPPSPPFVCDRYVESQHYGMECEAGGWGVRNPVRFSQIIHPRIGLNLNPNANTNTPPSNYFPPTREMAMAVAAAAAAANSGELSPRRGGSDPAAYRCDNSIIIQGKNVMKPCIETGYPSIRGGYKKGPCDDVAVQNSRGGGQICGNNNGLCRDSSLPFMLNFYNNVAGAQGYMHNMAKDQNGCRFLQKMVEEGTYEDIRTVFDGIINNVVELMVDPFGNYLVQKLLEVCGEEQRLKIVLMLTKEPGQLVRISLNTHGTRVVQKLIETLDSSKQISLVKTAIQPGFLDLIKDLNGNHVIQRCLHCFSCQDNEFIFDAGVKFCVDIATHRHGCCVLQRCIDYSVGKHRDKLFTEICKNGLLLSQDPFGNYVVQYILEMESPTASTKLLSQLKGNYVTLSTQKFSSHVVEKVLKHVPDGRSRIVRELLSAPHFEQLLQDPYANYVIQSALTVTKGSLHATLVEAVRPYKILRTSPYCKRIFSGNLLKK